MIPGTTEMHLLCATNWDSHLTVNEFFWQPCSIVMNKCISLGSVAVNNADSFREGDSPRYFSNVECLGNESNLLQCSRTEFTDLQSASHQVVRHILVHHREWFVNVS